VSLPPRAEPSAAPVVPSNVPRALSTFVGRAREQRDLREAIARGRLVTLTGPGGSGKTRLARELADAIAHGAGDATGRFADGVWWVDLAPLTDGASVVPAIAAVLQVNTAPGMDALTVLAGALATRRALLVLDNCEHVVDACAAAVETLLRATSGITVLATSREALAVEGEVAWLAPPLAHPGLAALAAGMRAHGGPTAAALAEYDAVRLFVDRARATLPTFTLTDRNAPAVADICARLDGLPLALELAAAAVGTLGVEVLAERLDDAFTVLTRGRRTAPSRQRTLRALLDWSYALLGEEERRLLQRLSVFRAGFTLEAVEAVCGDDDEEVDDEDVAALMITATHSLGIVRLVASLGRLVELSLVDVHEEGGEVRYRLLETVRQYGAALLRATPDAPLVRARHARWVARLSVAVEPSFWSPARGATVERLRHDLDDIRSALAWSTGPQGDVSTAIRIGGALAWFLISAGVAWEEGRAWTAQVLAAADRDGVRDEDRPLADRAWLGSFFYGSAGLAYFAGEPERMLTEVARALALWDSVAREPGLTPTRRIQLGRGRAIMRQIAGLAYGMLGDLPAAVREMDASVALATEIDDAWLAAVMRTRRALVNVRGGEPARAAVDYALAREELRAVGERWFLSLCVQGMAETEVAAGDFGAAARHAREAAAVLREEPDIWFLARALDTLAMVATVAAGADGLSPTRAATVARLLGAGAGLRARCGATVIGHDRARHESVVAAARAALPAADFEAEWAAGSTISVADAFTLAAEADVLAERLPTPAVASPAVVRAATPPLVRAAAAPAPADAVAETPATCAATSPTATALTVRVLGPLAMVRDGAPLPPDALPTGKARELLHFLLMVPRATKEQIGLALWPDASAAQVRNNFHVTLHHLRRALGDRRWIVFDEDGYRLERTPAPDACLDADVDAVLAAAESLRRAARRQTPLSPEALDAARAGLGRLQGELAEGMTAGDWLVEHQDRVRAAWADGMQALAQQLSAAGRHDEAAEALDALLARDPLREAAHRELMRAYVARGEPARALRHFEALTAMLRREVGAAPARETAALAAGIRTS
jgi:predicted ATPase/DNA-binding SARP family transcriptional activator